MSTAEKIPALLTPTEVARALRVSRGTVYRRIKDGSLLAVRLGNGFGPLRIPERELHELIAKPRGSER